MEKDIKSLKEGQKKLESVFTELKALIEKKSNSFWFVFDFMKSCKVAIPEEVCLLGNYTFDFHNFYNRS